MVGNGSGKEVIWALALKKEILQHYRDKPEVKRSNSIVKQQKQLIEKRVYLESKLAAAAPGKKCHETGIGHHASKIDFSNGRLSIIWLK